MRITAMMTSGSANQSNHFDCHNLAPSDFDYNPAPFDFDHYQEDMNYENGEDDTQWNTSTEYQGPGEPDHGGETYHKIGEQEELRHGKYEYEGLEYKPEGDQPHEKRCYEREYGPGEPESEEDKCWELKNSEHEVYEHGELGYRHYGEDVNLDSSSTSPTMEM